MPAHLLETPSLLVLLQHLLLQLRVPLGPHLHPSKQRAFARETIGLFGGPATEQIDTHEDEGEEVTGGGTEVIGLGLVG